MVVGSGSERNFWQIPQSSALSSLPPAAFRAMVAFHLPLWSGHFLPIFLCGFPPPGMPSALYSLAVRPKHPNLPLAQTLIFAFKPFVAALISCISHTGPIRSAFIAILYSLVKLNTIYHINFSFVSTDIQCTGVLNSSTMLASKPSC